MKSFKEMLSEEKEQLDEAVSPVHKIVNRKLKELGFSEIGAFQADGNFVTDKKNSKSNMKVPKELKSLFKELHLHVKVGGEVYEAGNISATIRVRWEYIHPDGGSNGKDMRYYYNGSKWNR